MPKKKKIPPYNYYGFAAPMTPEAFRAWMERRDLNPATRAGQVAAGALLAASQGEVSAWQRGTRAVPRRVARICELLDNPCAGANPS